MKATIIILLLAIIVFACHRKTAPSSGIIISNKTDMGTTKTQKDRPDRVSAGATVYTTRCGRCHGLKKTEKYTQQQWENILKTMIPKARLNDEQAKQVTAYVMANAKK